MSGYKVEVVNGFLAITHVAPAYDTPEMVTVAWVSKTKAEGWEHLVGGFTTPDGSSEAERTVWSIKPGSGLDEPLWLWTDKLSTPIKREAIKPPRARKGKTWRWDGAAGAWR